jgi:hypothetical protein
VIEILRISDAIFCFYTSERERAPDGEENQLSRSANAAAVSLILQVAIRFALAAQPSSFFGFVDRLSVGVCYHSKRGVEPLGLAFRNTL